GGGALAPGGGGGSSSSSSLKKLTDRATEYYKRLEDQKKIDRLDFINASKKIYSTYVLNEQQFDANIGRTRGYLSLSYSLLKKKLSLIGDDINNLPFVYGQSLGINLNNGIAKSGSGSKFSGSFIWPVDLDDSHANGDSSAVVISSLWGYQDDRAGTVQQNHPAIDVVGTSGKSPDIIAAAAGTVVDLWPAFGAVTIQTDDGKYLTQYMHMEPVLVSQGQHVEQGQVVGVMGGAGGYPVHLHFAIATDRDGDGRINDDMNTETLDPVEFYQVEPEYPYGDDNRLAAWRAPYTGAWATAYRYVGVRHVNGGDHPNIEGEGVERWRPYVIEALAEVRANTGLDIPLDDDMVNRTLQQMQNESSGTVDAINRWDSNASFDCSVGLLQVIAGTFNTHKRESAPEAIAVSGSQAIDPSDGRLIGYEDIYAAIAYAAKRYGPSIPVWPGGGY
ncbi:MAG: M23 family metallopeptidase, partial [Niameybacter sp.]